MAALYADEHVPLAITAALRRAGHDVARAQEMLPQGTKDETHFDRAVREGRVLLTQDSDFIGLSSKTLSQGKHHPGVVYWPQGVHGLGEVIRRLKQYLATTTPQSRRDLVKFL